MQIRRFTLDRFIFFRTQFGIRPNFGLKLGLKISLIRKRIVLVMITAKLINPVRVTIFLQPFLVTVG